MKKVIIADREVLPIGFGTSNIGDYEGIRSQELKALRAGIEAGIQVIDTAEMYGNGRAELLVGEAIKPFNRDSLYLVSKVLPENASKRKLSASLNGSLKRLGTDYLDLYLLHWQGSIPIKETIEEMELMKKQGKIKAWGVSNFDTKAMEKVLSLPKGTNCATNQVRYNIADRGIDFDLAPMMKEKSIPVMAYAPIARGDNMGHDFSDNNVLLELAAKYNCSVFQILLAWVIRNGNTIAIPRTGKSSHMISNVEAAKIELTVEDLQNIDAIYPKPTNSQPLALW